MQDLDDVPPALREALRSIYEEVMWLASRPNVTASRARAWYTHIMAESVKRQLRQFTGSVLAKAVIANGGDLRLEHYKRIQTTLTALVTRHRTQIDVDEFVRILIEYERVHIVTTKENYDAMRARGDYDEAGIVLVPWATIPLERRTELWRKMLRGRVANADAYAPQPDAAA
jgi:hypothetical protein